MSEIKEKTTKSVSKGAKVKAKSQEDPYLIGLDVGFGEMKLISSAYSDPIVIPSMVLAGQEKSNNIFDVTSIKKDSLVVTTDEGTFFVGERTSKVRTDESKRTLVRDRANDPISRVLFRTGLALGVPHEEGEYDVYVVTGLPNDDYDLSAKDRLKEFLSGSFSITFHLSKGQSITKTINILQSVIIPQPLGSIIYNQYAFDPENFIVEAENARESVGVIDFGHFTTDYALFEDGVIADSATVNETTVGVNELYKRLKRRLMIEFDKEGHEFKANDEDLDFIVRNNYVNFQGNPKDVTDIVEEIAKDISSMIAKDILDSWGTEVNRLDLIITTGGGSYLFAKHLEEEFKARNKQGLRVIDGPQFGNVIGFYMYGCMGLIQEMDSQEVYEKYVIPVFVGDE